MKGQAKRFLDHKGVLFRTSAKKKESDGDIGFFDLWRYSSTGERLATAVGVAAALASASALVLAVSLYGELTALFVVRHNAARAPGRTPILSLFGGGRIVPEGDRPLHMDALVEDAVAFAVASVAVMALQMAAATSAVTLANWAARRMTTRLRWRLLRAVLSQEVAFFDTNTSMNFAAALTEDMEKLRSGVGEHVAMTAHLAGSVAICAGAALATGWQLTLVGLAVVPFSVLVSAVVSKYQTRWSSAEVRASGSAARVVEQALANVRTVRAYAGEGLELNRYSEALAPAAMASKRRGLWAGLGAGLGWLLTYTLNAAVFAYGAELCARDLPLPPEEREYDPGVLVTVLFLSFMAAQNITLCSPHLELFSAARGAARGLFQLLERRPRIDALSEEGQRPEEFRGDIEFDNVYFNYPSRPDVKVLRGLSLKVRAGETVALVGGSGSGKSTLLQLLQRLYEPDSGSVSVDGQRLQRLDLQHYRRSIGVVGQEPVLFSGSIRDNIALGVEATHEEIVAAAQLAHAHQFISKLANGYDTMLGFGGASLSGGQKQRVAIARAVLRRPRILLLDEPTSALDPAAERLVQAALDNASQGRTTIVVSHRLSTIVNASRIVYMEQGAALEQGSHQELIERRGLYWRLLQEDMASRSIPATLSSAGEDEAEAEDEAETQAELPRADLRRSFSRQSTCRASLRMSSASAHVPAVAAHEEPFHTEEEVVGGEEKQPEASSWALLRLNAPEWPLLGGGGAAAFAVGASMPVFALLFAKLYGMFAQSDPSVIVHQSRIYALAFLGVAAFCGMASWLQAWLLNAAGARLTRRLREDCFQNYLQQEQGWFDEPQNSVGALCARLATDCAAVQGATGSRLGAALQAGSTVVVGAALALPHSWQMTLVSLLSVPAVIGAIYAEGYATRRAEVAERRALEQASRLATEAVINVRTVQSLGVEAAILSRYRVSLREANARAQSTLWARGPAYGLCLCAPTLGYAVSLAYGGWLVARQGLPFESAILVSEALIYGAWMLSEALSFAPSFAAARRSGSRILAALRREPNITTEGTAHDDPHWSATGAVEFSGVNFSYPTRRNAPVLRGLSLRLEPGQTVALVGASGCGKSTLLQLLLRSYDPDQGNVSLDGRDIRRSLPLPQLRAQLGLVQQEPVLFERTLRENIAYGDNGRDVSLDEVVDAAKQANIHGFISSLPLGYETRLGYGGASLSGGQKQRVAIARALLRRPTVLLLDEATSALDAASEKTVQAALEAASRGRTTLVIAHRLATVRHAHRICVVDRGVIAESGSHEELVRKRGLYWQLLQQQEPAVDA